MEDEDLQTEDAPTGATAAPAQASDAGTTALDPNVVVGTPTEEEVWLAPDWSDYGSAQKDKSWTRVSIRTTTYEDGRKITEVLDGSRKPVAGRNLAETIDPAQEKRWKEKRKQLQTAPPTKTVRGPDGKNHIMERNPDTGEYDIDRGLAPSQPTAAQRSPEQQAVDAATASKATEDERERAYHRALGHGNLTHKDYEDKLDKDQTAANAALTQARADKNQERITAAQEAANQLARDRLQHDKDKENQPEIKVETVEGGDGQSYTRHIAARKDGSAPTVTILGPDGKPVKAIPGKGGAAEPAGAPRMQLTLGTVTRDLQNRAEFLNTKVAKWKANPNDPDGLTPQQAEELMEKWRKLATSAVQEQTALLNGQRGIFSDEVGQRQDDITETASRRTAAGTARSGALAKYMEILPMMGEGGGQLLADAISAETDMAHANAGRWGGLKEHPRIELPPFLQQVRDATFDPTGAQVDQQTQSTIGETNAQIDRLTGGGSTAAAPAPEPAAVTDPTAAAAATPAPAPAAAAPPSLPNAISVRHKVTGRVSQVTPDQLETMTNRDEFDVVEQPSPAAPPAPVNPPAGQPGNDPAAPVGMAPPGPGSSPPPPFVDQARFGQEYDPSPVLSKLMQDPDLPPDWLFDAYRDVFKSPMKPKAA
jgi:hypothetical protein